MDYPFECAQCDMKYKHIQSLYRHKKINHEGRRFICHLCENQFTERANLKNHLKRCSANDTSSLSSLPSDEDLVSSPDTSQNDWADMIIDQNTRLVKNIKFFSSTILSQTYRCTTVIDIVQKAIIVFSCIFAVYGKNLQFKPIPS